MAYVLRKIVELHFYFNDECSDPRVKDWFLMSSPFPGMCLIAAYLYFVLKLGPKFMENRKPFQIDNIIKVYNAIQVVLCGWLFVEAVYLAYQERYSLLCQPVDFSTRPRAVLIARRCYFYFLIKVIDLLDTVFFVLRKKQNQVTFLHVYHHAGMVALSWSGTKYFPGGHSVFMGILNSLVHVVMYFYYFLTSLSPKYKQNLWWKKHITQLQIVQFGLIFVHWVFLIFTSCGFPRFPVIIIVPQNLFMFILFFDFYIRTYHKNPAKSKAQLNATQNGAKAAQNGVAINGQSKTNGLANSGEANMNYMQDRYLKTKSL